MKKGALKSEPIRMTDKAAGIVCFFIYKSIYFAQLQTARSAKVFKGQAM